jgi:putative sigma-54 modulation protein
MAADPAFPDRMRPNLQRSLGMKIEFTARNFTISPAIRRHITVHFRKIITVLNGATRAHVILSVEKHHRHVAEIVVNWHDRALTSKAKTSDMYASTLQAIDKMRRQAVKIKGKIIDRKHHAPSAATVAPSPLPPVQPDTPTPRIIRSRRYSVKPMTPEEAIIQVEETDEQFFVFRDADTDRIGVVYRRNDGNFGLIEP